MDLGAKTRLNFYMTGLSRNDFNVNAGSYETLINNNIATMGDRSTWRHMLSVVIDIGGKNYRLACKKILHKERCLNCHSTNKAYGFCYLKVREKDTTICEPVKQALRMWLSEIRLQYPDESMIRSLVSNGLTIFPPPETLKQTDGKKRIPEAHCLPCVNETFNSIDDGMNSFLRVSIFKDLCCKPVGIQLSSCLWKEDRATFEQRKAEFESLSDVWDEAKDDLHQIIKKIEKSWFTARHNKTCVVGGCKECGTLQKELKKQFRGLIKKGYEDHIKELFVKRKSFLRKVPRVLGIDINAHDSCAGLLGSREHLSDSDTVADLCITGLDPYYNGLVVDVSFTHPITGKGAAKGNAAHVKGHAAAVTENMKVRNYTAVCRAARYEFSAFVFETYGLMAPQSIQLLYRLATAASDQGFGVHDLVPGDTVRAYKGRLFTKWTRQLSLARIKTIADRLSGAALDVQSARLAARRPITTVAASQL